MINPETIDISVLPSVPLGQRSKLPQAAGIYFAIDSAGQIQYIGKSVNLRNRWGLHHRINQLERIGGVRIAWLEVEETSLLTSIEAALINWFAPSLNRTTCPKIKKEKEMAGEYRITISLSPLEMRKLILWSKVHGKSPTTCAGQMIGDEIEANITRINQLVADTAKYRGVSPEKLESQWLEEKGFNTTKELACQTTCNPKADRKIAT